MTTDDPRPSEPVQPADFGPAKKYARHGSINDKPGWQEKPEKPVGSGHVAPLAPEGSISRTPLAERLQQQVAEYEKE